MKVTAIVPAAGKSRRLKGPVKKPFLILGKIPVLIHTLSRLQKSRYINEIILVVDGEDLGKAAGLVKRYCLTKVKKIIKGAATRAGSVGNGLDAVNGGTDLVFIHDAARPFVSNSTIEKTIRAAALYGGAVAAVPAASTIKFVKSGKVIHKTLDRDKLWIAQTPQVFKAGVIQKAYKNKSARSRKIFDDSMLAEKAGFKVRVVPDSRDNIKITTQLDMAVGEAILRNNAPSLRGAPQGVNKKTSLRGRAAAEAIWRT